MNYLLRYRAIFLSITGLTALMLAVVAVMSQSMTAEGQSSPPAAQPPTHKAQVNFGYTLSDTSLTTLLDRHSVKVIGAYMTNEGFYGVHTAATSTAPVAFITNARAETTSGFTNGAGDGTTTRARDFVRKHTAAEVQQNEELQARAQSTIDLHGRLDRARVNAEGTVALIYAVVVTGSESGLTALGAERAVVDFEMAAIDSYVSWPQPSPDGGATGQSGSPSSSLTPAELHSRLSTLAQRNCTGLRREFTSDSLKWRLSRLHLFMPWQYQIEKVDITGIARTLIRFGLVVLCNS